MGAPNDRFEREADRVADRVLRMPAPPVETGAPGTPPTVQTKCAACAAGGAPCPACAGGEARLAPTPAASDAPPLIQRAAPEKDEALVRRATIEDEEELVQPKEASSGGQSPQPVPANVAAGIAGLRGGGARLPDAARSYFEPRFGRDFSAVRVHTGPRAETLARGLGARAFTTGADIAFGRGQYAPETTGGKRLLAHELTHVVQQAATHRSLQLKPLTDVENKKNLKSPRFKDNKRLQKAFDNAPVMRKGEPDGEAVKILQQALIDDLCAPGVANCAGKLMPISTNDGKESPDGIFGDETLATVQKFQIKHGLVDEHGWPDGRPGRKTLGRLDELATAPPAPAPAPAPPGPAPASGGPRFDPKCSEWHRCEVVDPLKAARAMVDSVLAELAPVASGSITTGRVVKLLNKHFHTASATDAKDILATFRKIRAEIDAPVKYICRSDDPEACKSEKGPVPASTTCSPQADIILCALYFVGFGCEDQAGILIHELAHHLPAMCVDQAYVHEEKYQKLGAEKAKKNPDSYAAFTKEAHRATVNCVDCGLEIGL